MFVPRLLINREAVGPFARPASSRSQDLAVTGDLVETVQKLTRVLGWKKPMEDLITENESRLVSDLIYTLSPLAPLRFLACVQLRIARTQNNAMKHTNLRSICSSRSLV